MGVILLPARMDLGGAPLLDGLVALHRPPLDLIRSLLQSAPRLLDQVRSKAASGHRWSLPDVLMVIGWVLAMPDTASRFQQHILQPLISGLPPSGSFLVAALAALIELSLAAMVARLLAGVLHEATRGVLRHTRHRG